VAPGRLHALVAALAAVAGSLDVQPADGGGLPPRSQALLLLRVLAYDRHVAQRAPKGVAVVVLARAGDRASEDRAAEVVAAFEEVAREVVVAGLPVRAEAVAVKDAAALGARLEAVPATLVYADAALAPAVPELARICRRRGALSAGASRAMVEAGLSVAIVARGSRAGVLVNLAAAVQEGAELDSALLAVAEVVRG
jgi:hypothetical protein